VDGRPAAGHRGHLVDERGEDRAQTVSDVDGIYSFRGLEAGRYSLGIELPHVALIAATETVNPKSPPSVQAAQITVMSKRHQLTGAIIDGPLGFDNAISSQAAKIKDIASDVSGKVDILVAPDLAAGNLLLKTLSTLCQVPVVNIVVGGKVPLVFWSPTDDVQTRMAATALGILCT